MARYQQFVVPICAGLVSEIHRLHINFSHVCRLAFSFELPFLFADHLQIIQRESVLVRWFKHALGCEVLFVVFPNKDMAGLIDRYHVFAVLDVTNEQDRGLMASKELAIDLLLVRNWLKLLRLGLVGVHQVWVVLLDLCRTRDLIDVNTLWKRYVVVCCHLTVESAKDLLLWLMGHGF